MATFTQFVSDDTTPTDSISKAPYIPFVDPVSIAEAITKSPARAFADSTSIADFIARIPNKMLSSALSLADSMGSRAIGKLAVDVAGITDSLSRRWVFARAYSDAATVSDSISKNPSKAPFVEVRIALSDRIGRLINKVVGEVLTLADKLIWPSNPRIMTTVDTSIRIMDEIVVGE